MANCPRFLVMSRRRVQTPAAFAPAFAVALILVVLLSGCSNLFGPDDDKPKHGEPTLSLFPRTSPENVLYDFKSIYAGADALAKADTNAVYWAGMYRTLFHPDSFKFYFIPGEEPLGFPEGWWGPGPEASTFENMLKRKVAGQINDIKLDWIVGLAEPDTRPGHRGGMYVHVTGILLDIVEDYNSYRVPNASADFYFLKDPADSTLWVVSEWYDHPSGSGTPSVLSSPGDVGASWGMLKVLYGLK